MNHSISIERIEARNTIYFRVRSKELSAGQEVPESQLRPACRFLLTELHALSHAWPGAPCNELREAYNLFFVQNEPTTHHLIFASAVNRGASTGTVEKSRLSVTFMNNESWYSRVSLNFYDAAHFTGFVKKCLHVVSAAWHPVDISIYEELEMIRKNVIQRYQ